MPDKKNANERELSELPSPSTVVWMGEMPNPLNINCVYTDTSNVPLPILVAFQTSPYNPVPLLTCRADPTTNCEPLTAALKFDAAFWAAVAAMSNDKNV